MQALSPKACEEATQFWPLWAALKTKPGVDDANVTGNQPLFPLAEILDAFRSVPFVEPPGTRFAADVQHYQPRNVWGGYHLWRQTEAYASAAAPYEAGDLPEAIRRFDAIVAGGKEIAPDYRAASAYTAARAAFRLGQLEAGAQRIAAILDDETLNEFWPQAWELIADLRFKTDGAPFAAAELAQISRILTTPTSILCDKEPYGSDRPSWILTQEDFDLPFPNFWFAGRDELMAPGVAFARHDPVIDAAYGIAHGDLATARAGWRKTRNPLWALALAWRGTVEDLPALKEAIQAVRAEWSKALSGNAGPTLAWELALRQAVILRKAGREAEALAALEIPTEGERLALDFPTKPNRMASDAPLPGLVRGGIDSVVNGVTRTLLGAKPRDAGPHGSGPMDADPADTADGSSRDAKASWEAARRWALAASAALHWPIDRSLRPFLVSRLDELYTHPALHLTPVDGEIRLGTLRWVLDRWSSPQLIAFARRPDVAPSDRQAMVGAAWIRAFALKRWTDVFAWLGDLRRAYPQLGPDIDLIKAARLGETQRRLALRLALRAPGLVALPSWSRPPGAPNHFAPVDGATRPADVFEFDPWNPSDGNWWCGSETEGYGWSLETDPDSWREPQDVRPWPDNPIFLTMPLYAEGAGKAELQAVTAAGSSTQRLAEDAVAWANESGWLAHWFGSDEHLPETLHLAVRATRLACRRPPDNARWSRAAFLTLHRRFPDSEWAAKTPYWFGLPPAPKE